MSVLMVFCGPRLPLAFQFVCGTKADRGIPNGTNVLKSGPTAKTTIFTVFRGGLRRRNQTKGNLPHAFQFVCGSTPPRGAQINWKVSGR